MVYGEGPIRVEDVIDILDTVRKLLSECRIPAIVCGQLYEQVGSLTYRFITVVIDGWFRSFTT